VDIIIVLIIAGLAAIFLTYPFFIGRKPKALRDINHGDEDIIIDPLSDKINRLESQKDSLYTAIQDIEFDYGLGKLSAEDYQELKQQYKLQAVNVLKKLDEINKVAGLNLIDSEIENEITAIRKSTSPHANLKCESCGTEYKTGDVFCSKCGSKLNGE